MVTYEIERTLLDVGFDAMDITQKNKLISLLANKAGKMYYEIAQADILQRHKDLRIEELKDKCGETIATGFVSSNGHNYRTNGDDRENMLGQAVELILDSTIATVTWKTEDIGYIDHTRDDWLKKVFLEALAFKKTTLFKYNTLKTQVISSTTDAEVLAVVW